LHLFPHTREAFDASPIRKTMSAQSGVTSRDATVTDAYTDSGTSPPSSQEVTFLPSLISVRDAAAFLGVSESWVRRHQHELPIVRTGRLVRFDSVLLRQKFHGKQSSGNRLKTGGKVNLQLRRYQRGYVYKTGKKQKVWYGMWRDDVRTPEGKTVRRQRNVRLGTLAELPTRTAAYEKLTQHMAIAGKPSLDMDFSELVRRWEEAVVPTIKATTANYYQKLLRAHILPHFGQQQISTIGRYEVEKFLAEQAKRYSRNTLRGMRVSLGRVLSWAVDCGWLEANPCSGVRLPRAGKRIVRTVLKPDQVVAIAQRLNQPYATLVLFLAVTGLRIGEAIGIKWSDFDGDVLNIQRRIYEGKADATKTEGSNRSLPIPAPLLKRMRLLGGQEWVFRSRENTPLNPGNALKRQIRPVTKALGIPLGGWHDFRHTLTTGLLRSGVSPKVVSEILGHADVEITLNVYDHPEIENFREPLAAVADQLLRDVTKSEGAT
jgi:integrase